MTQLRKSTRDPLGQKMAYKFAQLHVGQNDGAEGLVDLPEVDLKQKKNEIVNLSHFYDQVSSETSRGRGSSVGKASWIEVPKKRCK